MSQRKTSAGEAVFPTPLVRKSDDRGWLAEIFTQELSGGLVYGFQSKPGAVRGGHYHTRKSECFCILKGKVKAVLKNRLTGESAEYILDGTHQTQKLLVPPGTTHTFTTLGPEDSVIIAYVDEVFDAEDPDTFIDR